MTVSLVNINQFDREVHLLLWSKIVIFRNVIRVFLF